MAKKKKANKKQVKLEPEAAERSPFWGYSAALLLIVVALFLLLGGFGTGGALPKGLFGAGFWLFGWAVWLLLPILVFWGVYKFTSEEHRVPLGQRFSMIGLLIFSSGLCHVAFADKNPLGTLTGGHGGTVGKFIGGAVLSLLDKVPASLVFLLCAVLAFFFAFGISPGVVLKLFGRREREDTADGLEALQNKAAESGFKLNEGVPVEHHSAPTPRLSSLRNTAQKLSTQENHAALTAASDPDWKFPGVDLLNGKQDKADAGNVEANARTIHDTFEHFNIEVEMEGANIGPRVTQYTLKPPSGVKMSKMSALDENLMASLAAKTIRIEAPIPGKRSVGIEVPNVKPATVRIASILQSPELLEMKGKPLAFAIGKDISGKAVVDDLAKMPHLLIAGTTGSGKSVMINTFLTSLLYRNTPSDLKLILVDPKQVEMALYNDIPHLLTPVITEPEKVISALKWSVAEMERRLKTLAGAGKRNIGDYNAVKPEERMPYIVIVIDELADLMMMAARDVEALIVRIAQKARAVGIHLVLATQSPRATVITGLIKANVPARIAFTVAQELESRIIMDEGGAEKLLGRGDGLIKTNDMPQPKRVQAALIEDDETAKVVAFLRAQRDPDYNNEVVSQPVTIGKGGVVADVGGGSDADDDMFRDAVRVVVENKKASTSLLQRRLRIGYGRAARLIEEMEEQGIIGQADGSRPREVLVSSLDQVFGGGDAADSSGGPEAIQDVYPAE